MTVRGDADLAWHDDDGLGWRLDRLGPGALRLVAEAEPSAELSRRLATVRRAAWAQRTPGILDILVGYRTLTVEVRPGTSTAAVARRLSTARAIAAEDAASGDRGGSDGAGTADGGPRRLTLPVDYGDAADAEALVAALGIPWAEIVSLHAAARYLVAFLGFTPGFPYLHGLPAALALPRRSAPARMSAGAVAIADGRAGVYPSAGPGGWWSLGTTTTPLFDPWWAEPTALLPGDEVRFVPRDEAGAVPGGAVPGGAVPGGAVPRDGAGAGRRSGGGGREGGGAGAAVRGGATAPQARGEGAVTVVEAWPGGLSLQGRPRTGVGHLGMAQAGALDGRAFVVAARLAGSPLDAPALELAVPHATLRAVRPLLAAWAGGGARLRLEGRVVPTGRPFRWPAGSLLEVRPDPLASGATAVLAVGGGLAPLGGPVGHPALVGAGSTDARAGVGGFGRTLRAGDVLALVGTPQAPDPTWAGRVRHATRLALRLHPGPHREAAAYAALMATAYRLAARDRMGARLDGPAVHPVGPDVPSEGVPLGAVQLPADGRPIVLLADRGRTGGYAMVGVVDPRDLPALAQARQGSAIVFEPPTR